jgi:gamma-resorcylate decarboxylase
VDRGGVELCILSLLAPGIQAIPNTSQAVAVSRRANAKLPIGQYLRESFYITTSGNFRTQALTDVLLEVGADRVLYSVDYPFEDMAEATDWFDHAAISEPDRIKIARSNARQLFRL